MRDDGSERPRVRAVPVEESLLSGGRYDYADAFEVRMSEADPRTAEQWARCALEDAAWVVRRTVSIAHRYVLRFRLGPLTSPDHVLGWTIVTSQPDLIRLEAESPLLRGIIVGRRPDPTSTVLTTFVVHTRPRPARMVWTVIGPVHRRVARHLLARTAVRVSAPAEAVSATAGGPGEPSRPRRPSRAGAAGSRRGSSAWRRR